MNSIGISHQGSIMRRLLGNRTAPDSAHDTGASASVTSSPLAPHYRPTASQDVIYTASVPITCLDSSPDGRSAVLAGRHVLKTVVFDGLTVKDGIDLRALLIAQPSQRNSIPVSVADQLSIKAVRWGQPQGKQALFTAGTSGKIFQYDLVRAGSTALGSPVDCVQIREDSRQVNALDLNPHRNSWLLSGSQDGIVRCFDVRQPTQTRAGATFRSIQAFKCNADGVRHVQWNPKDGFIFACGTEQGFVSKWDMRKPSAPILRINAHEKTCTAMAWHLDGVHLVSAGLDSKCNIWDLSKQDKRQKPKWTLSIPAPAGTLAWRPGQWSATAQGKRASQLAVSYDESGQRRYGMNMVHIWDLARPTMPYKEIQRFDTSPSAMLWHDQYLLWTAGQDGVFSQCDVSFAPKVIDRQAVSTMAFSPRGDVLMLLDERAPPRRPRPHILHHDAVALPSYSSSPTTPKVSVSRSDSEDDAIGSFIGPNRRGSRRRRPSTRSTATLSTTPPVGPGLEDVMSLEQTIKATGPYRPQQAMAVGHVPAAANVDVYGYLAVNYLEALHRDLPYSPGAGPLPNRIATILEHYARATANVRQFRLAQTWRILAYAVEMLLHRRAQYHLDRRMDRHHFSARRKSEAKAKGKAKALAGLFAAPTPSVLDGEETPRKVSSLASFDRSLHPRSLLSEELESTSNVPTPVARPVSDDPGVTCSAEREQGRKLTPIVEPESFTLPPAVHPPSLVTRKRLDSVPLSVASHDSGLTHASTEGYDFYDTEAMGRAIDVPSPRSTSIRVHDYQATGSPSTRRKPVMRQNSDDSYVHLFSTSDESRRRATGLDTSSDGSLTGQAARAAILAELRSGNEEEFDSRVRGQALNKSSPERNHVPSNRTMLARTETDMTAFTDEHHAITQTTTDSFESGFPSQTDADFAVESPLKQPPSPESPISLGNDQSPFIVETDYLCWSDDLPYPYPIDPSSGFSVVSSTPLQPYALIARALAFEAKSSALNASAIILLLKPLLPDEVIDYNQAAAILRQHHARLMSMKLFAEAALLRKLCMKGWPGGALLSWGENYPAIFSPAHEGVQASLVCTACHKPRDVGRSAASTDSVWHCERCKAVMAPCAVCGERDTAPTIPTSMITAGGGEENTTREPVLTTWWYCPGCGHGGHSSCLAAWHAALEQSPSGGGEYPRHHHPLEDAPGAAESSDGCCPLDGCGHVCLPSKENHGMMLRTEEVSRVVREATRAVAKATVAAAAAAAAVAAEGRGAENATEVGGTGAGHDGFPRHVGEEHHQQQQSDFGGVGGGGVVMVGNFGKHGGGHGAAVRSDGNDIPQSRAVETVRETLAGSGSSARAGTGILSSSPGRGGIGAERERRKSVKFVATDERR
ncbi:hypothetical protein N657DRAFT_640459 [Parathielavia appendiculata]|uniref:Uncharacterized protein n=1 Tax=Parathielavia appendiculata TaxID=2587402 RepID=A0AAN6Z9P1_9PEZI|nr:hypothetical protein N657DRAFT_640459 [Parathielavia appendiculata]